MCAPCPRPACLRPAQSGFKVGKKRAGGWVILGQNIALFYKKSRSQCGTGGRREAFPQIARQGKPREMPGTPIRKLSSFYLKSCRGHGVQVAGLRDRSCRSRRDIRTGADDVAHVHQHRVHVALARGGGVGGHLTGQLFHRDGLVVHQGGITLRLGFGILGIPLGNQFMFYCMIVKFLIVCK